MIRYATLIAVTLCAFVIGRQTADRSEAAAPPKVTTEYRTYCPLTGGYWEPPMELREKLWNTPTAH